MGFMLTTYEDSSECQETSKQRDAVGQFLIFGAVGVKCEAKASGGDFDISKQMGVRA